MADGKRLASEPLPGANVYETARLRRIERAAYESPTMAGYRCAGWAAGARCGCVEQRASWGAELALPGVRGAAPRVELLARTAASSLRALPPPSAAPGQPPPSCRLPDPPAAAARLPRRLLPKFTPGRAFFWGTVLALWGTGALVAGTARSLDIHSAEEAPGRLRPLLQPVAAALEARLAPLRGSLSIGAMAGESLREDAQASPMVRRLRATLFGGSQ